MNRRFAQWLGVGSGVGALASLLWVSAAWGTQLWFLVLCIVAWLFAAWASWRYRATSRWLPLAAAVTWGVGVEVAAMFVCNTAGVVTVRRCFFDF